MGQNYGASSVRKKTQDSSRVGVTDVARGATQGLVKSYPMAAPAFSIQSQNAARLADPALREGLLKYARRRLPPGEVEDLVQNTLTDALVADNAPSDQADFRRWIHGIARHKIADSYRRRERLPILSPDADRSAATPSPSTGELSQWIESELPTTDGAQATLHWLLREGDGESLDEIARDVDLPAPRVRQRVSRLRRHLHARWLALGAAGLLLLIGAGALFYGALPPAIVPPNIAREPVTPLERARILRQNALQRCAAGAYPECIAALDQAQALDPSGESAIAIREARVRAANSAEPAVPPKLPAGSSSDLAPDAKSTPKQYAPRKVVPKQPAPGKLHPKQLAPSKLDSKQVAPSKPMQKSQPLGATQKQNALPSQQALPAYDALMGDESPSKEPQSKKR
jgi:RNA polymerase sigma factor (sigma-70 family)